MVLQLSNNISRLRGMVFELWGALQATITEESKPCACADNVQGRVQKYHSGLEIRKNETYSRHYTTTSFIKRGTIILDELVTIEMDSDVYERVKACTNNNFKRIQFPPKLADGITYACDVLKYNDYNGYVYNLLSNRYDSFSENSALLYAIFKMNSFESSLFFYTSFFAHNCDPNALMVFNKERAITFAVKDIHPEEVIYIHYGGGYCNCKFSCSIHTDPELNNSLLKKLKKTCKQNMHLLEKN